MAAAVDDSFAFFGGIRTGILQKRGERSLGGWQHRWFVSLPTKPTAPARLLYYDRASELAPPDRSFNVSRATLRIHPPSCSLWWALPDGLVISLRADAPPTVLAWAAACEAAGLHVDRGYVPQPSQSSSLGAVAPVGLLPPAAASELPSPGVGLGSSSCAHWLSGAGAEEGQQDI